MEALLLPEWAPNIHPMLVHFPIALFLAAVAMDILGYVLPESWWDEKKNLIIYSLSGLSAIVAYYSGKQAADSVFIEAKTQNLLTEHADWAEWTVWFMGLYALLRIGLYAWGKSEKTYFRFGLTIVSFGGIFLLYHTADRGAQMVYQHGVGVQTIDLESPEIDNHDTDHTETDQENATSNAFASITRGGSGNWVWKVEANASEVLKNSFHWINGSFDSVNPQVVENGESYSLSLSGDNIDAFFAGHDNYKNVQIDYYLNISGFEGEIVLANHIKDKDNYDFVSITTSGVVKQGRLTKNKSTVFEEGTADTSKEMFVRVVGNDTHFRGYVDQNMVVHGHGDAPDAGGIGLKINGSGTVLINKIELTQLK